MKAIKVGEKNAKLGLLRRLRLFIIYYDNFDTHIRQ